MTNLSPPTTTTAGKVAVAFLVLSILSLICIGGAGGVQGELRGGIAFGLVVAAAFLIPVLVLNKWVPNVLAYSKAAWLTYCIASLVLMAFAASQSGTKDLDIVVTILAAMLAFPIGIIVAVAGSMLYSAMPPLAASTSLLVIAFALGYWQWFVLWPKITLGPKRIKGSKLE